MASSASTEIIEIDGGLVTIYQKSILMQRKTEDLLPHLVVKEPVSFPILPRNAVFAHWDESDPSNKLFGVLCEIPPGIRNIKKSGRYYKLAMPWTYLWFTAMGAGSRWGFQDYRCFHTPKQYESVNDPLTVAFLPNLYQETGSICFGAAGANASLPINKQIESLVNTWYNTDFNADLDQYMVYPFETSSFKRWVEESEKDSMCWRNFPEWNNGVRKSFKVTELLSKSDIRPNEITSIPLEIPPISVPLTFLRAEEWLSDLPNESRLRLRTALANLTDEQPNFIEDMPEIFETEEDGGVLINE